MYEFPPIHGLWGVSWTTIGVHLTLVGLILTLLWRAIRQHPTGGDWRYLMWILSTVVMIPVLLFGLTAQTEYRPLFIAYGLLGLACGVTGSYRSVKSIPGKDQAFGQRDVVSDMIQACAYLFILGMVVPLMLPTTGSREAPRRTQCKNNLKQLALAFHNFHDVHERFPSAGGPLPNSDETTPLSWRVALLPYVDQQPLFETYDTSQAWDSSQNRPLQFRHLAVLACPSAPNFRSASNDAEEAGIPFVTSYVVPTGNSTVFGDPTAPAMPLTGISDGSSNTILVVEACGTDIIWTEPRDLDVTKTELGINLPGSQSGRSDGLLSSYHSGGAQVALADGSVRFVSETVDPQILKKLTTANADDGPAEQW